HFLVSMRQLYLHFFFQAEDGIRDRNVTGVQTCALPILGAECSEEVDNEGVGRQHFHHYCSPVERRHLLSEEAEAKGGEREKEKRSEERRVGKERRQGWGGRH